MSALPCPVADPFAVADDAYATITKFLHSEEARRVKHSDLERQLEAMGRELMRKLLQAHLDLRQPGEAREPVRDAAGATLTPTPVHTQPGNDLRDGRSGPHRLSGWRHAQSASARRCAQSSTGEVLVRGAAPRGHRGRQGRPLTRGSRRWRDIAVRTFPSGSLKSW